MAETKQRLSNSFVLRAGAVSVVAAVLANVLARFLLGLIVPLSPDFQPFGYGPIIFFTVMFTVIGVLVLWVVNRLFANPLKVYNIVGIVAFFISLAPNLAGAANPAAMPMGGKGSDYLILILFHAVAAIAFLGALNRLSRSRTT